MILDGIVRQLHLESVIGRRMRGKQLFQESRNSLVLYEYWQKPSKTL